MWALRKVYLGVSYHAYHAREVETALKRTASQAFADARRSLVRSGNADAAQMRLRESHVELHQTGLGVLRSAVRAEESLRRANSEVSAAQHQAELRADGFVSRKARDVAAQAMAKCVPSDRSHGDVLLVLLPSRCTCTCTCTLLCSTASVA